MQRTQMQRTQARVPAVFVGAIILSSSGKYCADLKRRYVSARRAQAAQGPDGGTRQGGRGAPSPGGAPNRLGDGAVDAGPELPAAPGGRGATASAGAAARGGAGADHVQRQELPVAGAATDDCAICCEPIAPSSAVMRCTAQPRPHYFHAACLSEWIRRNPSCPVCRRSVQFNQRNLHEFLRSDAARARLSADDRSFWTGVYETLPSAGWAQCATWTNARRAGGLIVAFGAGFAVGYSKDNSEGTATVRRRRRWRRREQRVEDSEVEEVVEEEESRGGGEGTATVRRRRWRRRREQGVEDLEVVEEESRAGGGEGGGREGRVSSSRCCWMLAYACGWLAGCIARLGHDTASDGTALPVREGVSRYEADAADDSRHSLSFVWPTSSAPSESEGGDGSIAASGDGRKATSEDAGTGADWGSQEDAWGM